MACYYASLDEHFLIPGRLLDRFRTLDCKIIVLELNFLLTGPSYF